MALKVWFNKMVMHNTGCMWETKQTIISKANLRVKEDQFDKIKKNKKKVA